MKIVLTVILLGIVVSLHVNAKNNACTTTECVQASAHILERIDIDIDPCDNFYDFACGSFIDNTQVPDEHASENTLEQYKSQVDQQLISLIERGAQGEELTKLTKGLYDACMENNQHIQEKDSEIDKMKELKEIIETLGGWPLLEGETWNDDKWSFERTIQKIRNLFGHRTDKIIEIASSKFIMQSNPLLRQKVTSKSRREAYFLHILRNAQNLLPLTGDNMITSIEIDEMLDFEYKLNELNYRLQQISNSFDLHSQSKDFIRKLLYIQWLEYFHPSQLRDIQIEEIDKKVVESSDILDEMRDLLNRTSIRTQANFLIWRLVDYAGSQKRGAGKYSRFELERAIYGRQDFEQQWKECINVVESEMPFLIGLSVTNSLAKNFKSSINEMFNYIKEEFVQLIANAPWINEAVREGLQSKLETLKPLISHPAANFNQSEIIEFYNEIKIDPNQYIHTLFQLRIIDADNKFRQTYATTADTVNDVDNWKKYLPPSSLTAFYSESDNTLRISNTILINPISVDESLKVLNYASSGFIIAHHISHIVDQFIRQANTWPEKFRNEFIAEKQCLIEQYSAYQDPETSKNLDGKRIVSENIADQLGFKLAYSAYKRWNSDFHGERHKLIGIKFTQNQLFLIAMAQTWCNVDRIEEMERKITSDIYAPERFRINGMLQNSVDFSDDFKCSANSEMNPTRKCVIY